MRFRCLSNRFEIVRLWLNDAPQGMSMFHQLEGDGLCFRLAGRSDGIWAEDVHHALWEKVRFAGCKFWPLFLTHGFSHLLDFVGMLEIDPSSSWGYPIPNFQPAPFAQFSWLFQHFKRLQKCHAASVISHQLRPLLYFCWELWWVVWWAVRHAQLTKKARWNQPPNLLSAVHGTRWNQPPNITNLMLLLRPNSLGEWNDHASKRWLGKVHSHPPTSRNVKTRLERSSVVKFVLDIFLWRDLTQQFSKRRKGRDLLVQPVCF